MVEPRWYLHIACTSSSSQIKHKHDNMTLKNMRLTKAHLDKALAEGVTWGDHQGSSILPPGCNHEGTVVTLESM